MLGAQPSYLRVRTRVHPGQVLGFRSAFWTLQIQIFSLSLLQSQCSTQDLSTHARKANIQRATDLCNVQAAQINNRCAPGINFEFFSNVSGNMFIPLYTSRVCMHVNKLKTQTHYGIDAERSDVFSQAVTFSSKLFATLSLWGCKILPVPCQGCRGSTGGRYNDQTDCWFTLSSEWASVAPNLTR